MRGSAEYNTRVVTVPLGTLLSVVVRQGGKDERFVLRTAEISLTADEHTMPSEFGSLAGLVVSDIVLGNPLYGERRGSQVVRVPPDTPAAKTGLQKGDVVVGVDDQDVRRSEQFYRYADRAGMSYRLRIVRSGQPGWLRISR